MSEPRKFLTTAAIAVRYQRGARTIARWVSEPPKAPPGFPRPIMMNRRWLWLESDLADWERSCASRRAAA